MGGWGNLYNESPMNFTAGAGLANLKAVWERLTTEWARLYGWWEWSAGYGQMVYVMADGLVARAMCWDATHPGETMPEEMRQALESFTGEKVED